MKSRKNTSRCHKASPARSYRAWFLAGAAVVLLLVAARSLICMTRAWDKPLLGPHAFRQTQTAISAYYMARDPGMFLNYITPVLGKPWEIPMEVPYYQWLVARWHNLTGMPLDASGRLVSIFFLLACLWPAALLLRSLDVPWPGVLVSWCLILSSPLYLFWGGGFLIETTGLFFSLGMTAFTSEAVRRRSPAHSAAAFLFGLLAITCKATTWALAAGVAFLLFLCVIGRENPLAALTKPAEAIRGPQSRLWLVTALCAASLIVCYLIGKAWLDHADRIKSRNPFARELIIANSENQKRWNYGTLEQKLDPATWRTIGSHVSSQLLPASPLAGSFLLPAALLAGLVFMRRGRLPALALLAGFAAGPLVFTNLYFEHSYYWMANGVWLLLAAGAIAGRLVALPPKQPGKEAKKAASVWLGRTAAVSAVALTVVLSGFAQWSRIYLPILQSVPSRQDLERALIEPARKIVPPGRSLLVLGHDWNPVVLYYAERKGIAFPTVPWIPFPGPQLDESLALFDDADRPGGILAGGAFLQPEAKPAVEAFLARMGAVMPPAQTPFGLLFRVPAKEDQDD